jgi:hypothetical protein
MHGKFCSCRKLDQDGFVITVATLIIFATIIVVSITAFYIYYKRTNIYLQSKQSEQFDYIQKQIDTFYYQNVYKIETNSGNVLQTNQGTFSNYSQLANYLGLPATDAWNNPYVMFISNRLTDNITGNYYHLVYIVSLGSSHKLQSTFDPNTGALTLKGTNTMIEINGKEINNEIYLENANRLENLANKIRGFVKALYIANNKQPASYFYNSHDSTCQNLGLNYGGGVFGCYQNTPIGQTNLPQQMGLGNNEYTNTLGVQFVFDNASSDVATTPPAGQSNTIYTARVGIPEPNGVIQWILFNYQ